MYHLEHCFNDHECQILPSIPLVSASLRSVIGLEIRAILSANQTQQKNKTNLDFVTRVFQKEFVCFYYEFLLILGGNF